MMASLVWQGQDFRKLSYGIVALFEKIEVDARQILDDIAREAVDEMYQILVNAVTDTGRDRAASGQGAGIAGRVDTGKMARDIKAAIEGGAGEGVVLTWGWVDDVEDYYLLQEYGTDRIKAMSALQGSYVKAREKFRQRLQDMGLEVR